MFLFNEERHIEGALTSLLSQTHTNFQLIVLNDSSRDMTEEVILKYAQRDSRIRYLRNSERRGYIANYVTTFRNADKDVKYFAWAAGHDIHHPDWLSTLVRELEGDPRAVMAYPLTRRISETGEDLQVPSPRFETRGLQVKDRIRAVTRRGVGFGNMIYGLFRVDALQRAGVFRKVLLPDTLLITEISLFGTILQVEEELWFRRYVGLFSTKRQRGVAFARPPLHAYVPWWVTHVVVLLWNRVLRPGAGSFLMRRSGLVLSVYHLMWQTRAFGRYTLQRFPRLRSMCKRIVGYFG